jgi:hypothetical protein
MSKAAETPDRMRHARVGIVQTGNHHGAPVSDGRGVMPIYLAVTIQPLAGYVSTTRTPIAAALAAWVAKGSAGQHACRIYRDDLLAIAKLRGQTAVDGAGLTPAEAEALGASYTVISIQIGTSWSSLADADLTVGSDRMATCSADDIRFTVF